MKSEKDLIGIKDVLRYEPDTGKFFWIKRQGSHGNPNEEAGYIKKDGYRVIEYNYQTWKASRLAWYFIYGYMPIKYVDHINGNRDDNSKINLRGADVRQNGQNRKEHRAGRLVGAYRRGNRWSAQMQINNKKVWLGTFNSEKEASDKYWEYVSRLKEPPHAAD